MASVAGEEASGPLEFLREALAQLRDPRWRVMAVLFLLFLGGTNALLAVMKPGAGEAPGAAFALAGLVRLAALVSISVAALRIATDSPRPRWKPDAAWWLFLVLGLMSVAVAGACVWLGRGLPVLPRLLLADLAAILLLVPFSAWFVAAAVERPLAWSPAPGLRRTGRWLGPMLLWSLLLAAPLALAHAWLSLELVAAAGTRAFLPLAATDALVSSIYVLLVLALRTIAYRRVAQG